MTPWKEKRVIGNATLYLGDMIQCSNENQFSPGSASYTDPALQIAPARGGCPCNPTTAGVCADC